ncbi:hypothetical protein LX64_04182 [Chitinophaga skermanii]|uniref:HTH cro/C1-type domain-containing protein n=1 Tax=Chitinophaga skermanii TaxID=331697 RepID=A0A327Q7A8_9BACT|nr:hypothetical protein [Chitinophaga skermanii]RAJ00476.1 hypothetical protein LX64_04182 [Chitinophaga skermanii]
MVKERKNKERLKYMGSRVREERLKQELELADVAYSSELEIPQLSNFERGKSEIYGTSLVLVLAFLNIDPRTLVPKNDH